jgi:ssDNA-binding Zn-finger/Zn-ribbon topoisomerase 1
MKETNKIISKYQSLFTDCFDFSIAAGWFPIVERLCEFIINNEPNVKIKQIKEKFGELRFYTDGNSYDLGELIESAMEESLKTCEKCGSIENVETKTKDSEHYWIRTLCSECRKIE